MGFEVSTNFGIILKIGASYLTLVHKVANGDYLDRAKLGCWGKGTCGVICQRARG